MLDQLGTDNLYALFQHAKGKKTFRFATACSGSDIIVSYIKRLAAQLSSLLGQEVKMEHIFSCEHIPWKREWIDDNFKKDGPKFIFGPVEDLTWNTAHDHKSGNIVLVPDVDVFIAGFSCRDASRLSTKHSAMYDCIERESGSTGGTFKSICGYLQQHQPTFVVLENVPSLGDKPKDGGESNLAMVHRNLQDLNYKSEELYLNAMDYLLPQSRGRLYIPALHCEDCDHFANKAWAPKLRQAISELRCPLDHGRLKDFLLDSEIVEGAVFPALEEAPVKKAREEAEWQDLHHVTWMKLFEEHPGAIHLKLKLEERMSANNYFVKVLTPRQKDHLIYRLVSFNFVFGGAS